MFLRTVSSPADRYKEKISNRPGHVQCRNGQVGPLRPHPLNQRKKQENESHDKMKIAGFSKIGAPGLDSADQNIFRRNNNPGHKAGNDENDCSDYSYPFHPAHWKNLSAIYDLLTLVATITIPITAGSTKATKRNTKDTTQVSRAFVDFVLALCSSCYQF